MKALSIGQNPFIVKNQTL